MTKRQFTISNETLSEMLDEIREEIENGGYTDEGKEKWNREVEFVLNGEDINDKFIRLINTHIFTLTFGERANIDNGVLSVVSEYYGKGTQNTYFPIF